MKDEIIETSLQQFLLHGIRKMTVKDIVSPLGISTKTVYKYFADKEALLSTCLELHYGNLQNDFVRISKQVTHPLLFIFQVYIRAIELDFKVNALFYHDLNYYYPQLQDSIISKHSAKLGGPLIDAVRNSVEQGYIRGGLHAEVVFEGLGILYRSLTRGTDFQKFNLSPFQLAANTMEVYLRGMCTEKGLTEINNNPLLTSFIQINQAK